MRWDLALIKLLDRFCLVLTPLVFLLQKNRKQIQASLHDQTLKVVCDAFFVVRNRKAQQDFVLRDKELDFSRDCANTVGTI